MRARFCWVSRRVLIAIAMIGVLLLSSCGGVGHDGREGACVVDGTRSCTDNVGVDFCQGYLHGDHYYEGRQCRDLGFPK